MLKRVVITGGLLGVLAFGQDTQQMQFSPQHEQIVLRQIMADHDLEMLRRDVEMANAKLTFLHMQLEEIRAAQPQPVHHRKVVMVLLKVLPYIDHAGSVASIYSVIPR